MNNKMAELIESTKVKCFTKKVKEIEIPGFAVFLPDAHIQDNGTSNAYKVCKQFIKDMQPNKIIIPGDWMDVASFSAWDRDKRQLMEGRRWKKECCVANIELDFLQENSEEVVFLGGNHEDRVRRYVEIHPEVEGLVEVELMLKLKERGIKWIPYTSQEVYMLGKLLATHGWITTENYTKKTLEKIGCNCVVCHTHRPQTYFATSKMTEAKFCWGLGTLGDLEPEYLAGKPSTSNHGFGVCSYKKNGNFSFYPINQSKNGGFMWERKEYSIEMVELG